MLSPDPNERLLCLIMICILITGWVVQGLQNDLRIMDARILNIEMAREK